MLGIHEHTSIPATGCATVATLTGRQAIGSRRTRSGSTPRSATMNASTPGSATHSTVTWQTPPRASGGHYLWVAALTGTRISVSPIWRGMCGSGATTGLSATLDKAPSPRATPPGLRRVAPTWFAAAPGTSTPPTCAARLGTSAPWTSAATTSGFVSRGLLTPDRLATTRGRSPGHLFGDSLIPQQVQSSNSVH